MIGMKRIRAVVTLALGLTILIVASSCASLPRTMTSDPLALTVQVLSRTSCSSSTSAYSEAVSLLIVVQNNGTEPVLLTRGAAHEVQIAASMEDALNGRLLYTIATGTAGVVEEGAGTHLLTFGDSLADAREIRIPVRHEAAQDPNMPAPGRYIIRFVETYYVRPQGTASENSRAVTLPSQPIELELPATPEVRECAPSVRSVTIGAAGNATGNP